MVEDPTGEQTIESRVFLSGVILIWSQDRTADLTGLSGQMKLTIKQRRDPESAVEEEPIEELRQVFSRTVGVVGGSGGDVRPIVEGEITTVLGGSEMLLAAGLDIASLPDSLDRLGRLHVLLVPEQVFPYRYPARAGEEFELVGVNPLDDFALASPAIVGDRLLIRTQSKLYSIRRGGLSSRAPALR